MLIASSPSSGVLFPSDLAASTMFGDRDSIQWPWLGETWLVELPVWQHSNWVVALPFSHFFSMCMWVLWSYNLTRNLTGDPCAHVLDCCGPRNKLEYNGYDAPAEHVWPSVPTFLLTTEMLFGSLFTIECMAAWYPQFFLISGVWCDDNAYKAKQEVAIHYNTVQRSTI